MKGRIEAAVKEEREMWLRQIAGLGGPAII